MKGTIMQEADDKDFTARARRANLLENWPYGSTNAGLERVLSWAEDSCVKQSNGSRCLHWLINGRCGVRNCHPHDDLGSMYDHVSSWNTNGGDSALLLMQPYSLSSDDLITLGRLAIDPAFKVSVTTLWYGHGTVAIEIWNAQTYEWFVKPEQDLARQLHDQQVVS
jgi:hypothetical protein